MLRICLKSRIIKIESSLSFLCRVKDIDKFFISGTLWREGREKRKVRGQSELRHCLHPLSLCKRAINIRDMGMHRWRDPNGLLFVVALDYAYYII